MSRTVEVVPHNPNWATQFEAEANRIRAIFGDELVAIHHIGSTAIPGIRAKPIIDLLVEVSDIEKVEAFNEPMIALGYEPMGEFGIAGRRYFQKGGDARTHHVHAYQAGHPEIARHIHFRDYVRAHPDDAQAYSQLKEQLAQQYRAEPLSYTEAKSDFVREIDRKAEGWWNQSQEVIPR